MSRIIVEYDPNIGPESKEKIRNNITQEMSSNSGDTHQYLLEHVLNIKEFLVTDDVTYLKQLEKEGVSYIEF